MVLTKKTVISIKISVNIKFFKIHQYCVKLIKMVDITKNLSNCEDFRRRLKILCMIYHVYCSNHKKLRHIYISNKEKYPTFQIS